MFRSVRGMRDVFPEEARRWRELEERFIEVLIGFGYEEIQLPLLEVTELFARGVGEATDIVEKEMYSLDDRDGDSITLRPEGTAGCARALLEGGLLHNQSQRVFYRGPMFRYERPQKGRYRQFYQIGAEAFGLAGPDLDAELIALGTQIWRALGIDGGVTLELNTIGSAAARAAYREALVAYLSPRREELDADSRRRLETNPLRILDSKAPETQAALDGAPLLLDFLDTEGLEHYEGLKRLLGELGIAYVENRRLVRGFDYYTNTVFEWTTEELGSQGAICAGGRYDGLVELIGGKATPGAGFAAGLERALLLAEALHPEPARSAVDVYCCVLDPQFQGWALGFAQKLRDALPSLKVRMHAGGGKLKNQLKRADQSGATWALLIGEDEVARGAVSVKHLRERGSEQAAMELQALIAHLSSVEEN